MTSISGLTSTSAGTTATSPTSGASSAGTTSTGTTGTSTGSAVLSSAGIGSGLDVDAIVTALVNAKKAGPAQQINARTTQLQSQEAGLTALGSALGSLRTALGKLASDTTYQTYTATLSDSTLGSTRTLPSARPGIYQISVDHLAAAQKRSSDAYPAGSTPGAGTLTISVGGKSVDIAVSATDSLSTIAAAINSASGNPGVQAAIVNGANGAQLLLSSTKTGVANAFSISASADSSAGLSALAAKLGTPGSSEASDASLSIDGIPVTSASNSVSGALDGVTLDLAATGSATLTVSQNTDAVKSAVSDFVSAYNSYAGTVATLSSYDATTRTAGVLLGDSTLMAVQRQINGVLNSRVSGNSIGSLAALGITRNADGTLALDSDKLDAAIKSSPDAVQQLFAGSNGYATRLDSVLDDLNGSGGIIAQRTASIEQQLTKLGQASAALDARMSVYEAQLRQQYSALDTLMSSLTNTSNYLTGALKQLEATYTSKN